MFGRSYDYDEIEELMMNDAAVFAGAFIFKFCWVLTTRLSSVRLFDPSEPDLEKRTNVTPSETIKSLGYLFPLSCIPNSRMIGAGNRQLMYALSLIKKGTVLTTSVASIYESIPKSKRQAIIFDFYNRTCQCPACTENWLESRPDDKSFQASIDEDLKKFDHTPELNSLFKKIAAKAEKSNNSIDMKFLTRIKLLVEKSWDHFCLPSYPLVRATTIMMNTMDSLLTLSFQRAPSCEE
ncbi:hypothetical protein QAD02_001305 [Eretmocerus hayati]|uniref:Uncharacterized protein n=1 Tax=Eretmocerus hayati TaxID=131215 RepID=A0ACC2NHE1_9HYME|nr:hypothetical protein QAD02_001305 [Eretmocerus hayati]